MYFSLISFFICTYKILGQQFNTFSFAKCAKTQIPPIYLKSLLGEEEEEKLSLLLVINQLSKGRVEDASPEWPHRHSEAIQQWTTETVRLQSDSVFPFTIFESKI